MRIALAIPFVLAISPVAAFAQDGAPVQDQPAERERGSLFEDSFDQADRERGEQQVSETDARLALGAYGKCVAERKPREANRVLAMDFTTSGYRTGLRLLSQDAERNCARGSVGRGNVMRSGNLLFAGAVAEALLAADATPLNVRLARSAARQVPSYSPTDAVAQCLARSLPDQVAALFATVPGSEAETATAAPLVQAVPACANAAGVDARIEATVPALRAMIATAAYRLVQDSGEASS